MSVARIGAAQCEQRSSTWTVIDRICQKYTGGPCPRDNDRVVLLIEPDRAQALTFG